MATPTGKRESVQPLPPSSSHHSSYTRPTGWTTQIRPTEARLDISVLPLGRTNPQAPPNTEDPSAPDILVADLKSLLISKNVPPPTAGTLKETTKPPQRTPPSRPTLQSPAPLRNPPLRPHSKERTFTMYAPLDLIHHLATHNVLEHDIEIASGTTRYSVHFDPVTNVNSGLYVFYAQTKTTAGASRPSPLHAFSQFVQDCTADVTREHAARVEDALPQDNKANKSYSNFTFFPLYSPTRGRNHIRSDFRILLFAPRFNLSDLMLYLRTASLRTDGSSATYTQIFSPAYHTTGAMTEASLIQSDHKGVKITPQGTTTATHMALLEEYIQLASNFGYERSTSLAISQGDTAEKSAAIKQLRSHGPTEKLIPAVVSELTKLADVFLKTVTDNNSLTSNSFPLLTKPLTICAKLAKNYFQSPVSATVYDLNTLLLDTTAKHPTLVAGPVGLMQRSLASNLPELTIGPTPAFISHLADNSKASHQLLIKWIHRVRPPHTFPSPPPQSHSDPVTRKLWSSSQTGTLRSQPTSVLPPRNSRTTPSLPWPTSVPPSASVPRLKKPMGTASSSQFNTSTSGAALRTRPPTRTSPTTPVCPSTPPRLEVPSKAGTTLANSSLSTLSKASTTRMASWSPPTTTRSLTP